MLGTVLLDPLLRAYPGVELGIWIKRYAAGVFPPGGPVRVHAADPAWDRAPGSGKGTWTALLGELRAVRAARYDLALVLNAEWRRALFLRLAGIPARVGVPRSPRAARLLTRCVDAPPGTPHAAEEHLALLTALPDGPQSPAAPLPRLWVETASRRSRRRPLLVLHPISGDALKNWPLPLWVELALRLRESRAARCVVLSAPGEAPVLREAFAGLPPGTARVLVVSLEGAARLLGRVDLFIGGDSGPGHMAAALGATVLSLFGPTSPERYRPLGPGPLRVLRREPLRELGVAAVEREAQDML